jgi:LysM repeat protein
MVQNEIEELPRLTQERLENIFNIYLNDDNRYFYNLLQNINFPEDLPDGLFKLYTIEPEDTLPLISHKVYGTINLWWAICLPNKINNPIIQLQPGTVLKILNNSIIRVLLQQINS